MATEPKIKSMKEVLAENLTELIDRNPTIAALILLSVIVIPWSIQDFLSPAMRFTFLVLAPQIWRGGVESLTQPVLFLLVNLVIVSIMISSGSVSWTGNGKEVNFIERYANVAKVHSDQSALTAVSASRSPSPPDKTMQKVWPAPPIPLRLDSDNERQFSSQKRSFSFSHSYNTIQLLPRRSLPSTSPAEQQGSPPSPPESTSETQSEQTLETTKPSSSYARQSDQQRGSMECIFRAQTLKFAEADASGRGLILDAKRVERGNSALQKGSSEQIKKTTWKSYSDDEKPSLTSYSEHERSTRKSFSETSEVDTIVQTGQGYSLKSSSAKRSAYVGASSSVIVRDVSADFDNSESSAQSGVRDPLVIDLEELNERIQALYAKHREQARQDSLRRN